MNYYDRPHWGNCLTAAIGAKIRDWKNIKIIYLPPEQANSGGFPHFLWFDKLDNNVYDFKSLEQQNSIFEVFWCKGEIKRRPLKVYQSWCQKNKEK